MEVLDEGMVASVNVADGAIIAAESIVKEIWGEMELPRTMQRRKKKFRTLLSKVTSFPRKGRLLFMVSHQSKIISKVRSQFAA